MILDSQDRIRKYTDKGWWGTETLGDLLLRNARRHPEMMALVDPPNRADLVGGTPLRLTYAVLEQVVDRLAGGLLAAGIEKDDIMMVQLPNTVELVCVYLAAARLGAIVSPVPMQYRTHELRFTMRLVEPKAYITTTMFSNVDRMWMLRDLQPEIPSLQTVIVLEENIPHGVLSLRSLMTSPQAVGLLHAYTREHPVSANDILTICWTSGTEAEPKGVPRSHNQWIWIGYATVDGCQLADGCHMLSPFPMVNMAGIGGMLVPWLQVCGKLVLHHPMNLPVFLTQLSTEQINYTVAPPALLNGLLLQPRLLEQVELSAIKCIGSGGAPLAPGMVSHYQHIHGIAIVNLFGSNEGASFTSGVNECADPAERAYCFPRFGVPEYSWSSRIAAHMSTKLVDPDTKAILTEKGHPGELAIKSPGIFPGYYKRPDLTRAVFDDEGYFYTGDLFEIAGEDGRFYAYVGRLKDVIKRGAMAISPEEIEYLLSEHPHVAEVAVVAYPDPVMGEKLCAVIVPREGQQIALEEIIAFLKSRDIAAYKLPEKLVIVERLPRNPVGKVLKNELRQQIRTAATIGLFNDAAVGK